MPDNGKNSTKTLDCLLIHAPKQNDYYKPLGRRIFGTFMAQGLLAVADQVHRAGHTVEVLHLGVEKLLDERFSLRNYIERTRPRVIGLSLHWHHQSYDVIRIADEIKDARPETVLVLGGLTASFFGEEILRDFPSVDAVIQGDGETPLPALVRAVAEKKNDLSSIPNLVWRKNGSITRNPWGYTALADDLGRLNFTNFSLLKNHPSLVRVSCVPWYWHRDHRLEKQATAAWHSHRVFPLPLARGCDNSCSYCGGSRISHRLLTHRSSLALIPPQTVLRSMNDAAHHGYDTVWFEIPRSRREPDHGEKLLGLIKDQGTPLHAMFAFQELPSENMVRLLSGAFKDPLRCLAILSPESGSERIRALNKGNAYSNEEMIRTIERLNHRGFPTVLCFTLGLPFEKRSDIQETLRFQKQLRRRFGNAIAVYSETILLEPASPMYLFPDRYRIVKTRMSFRDFVAAHAPQTRETALGYANLDFDGPPNAPFAKNASGYETIIRKLRCRYFCGPFYFKKKNGRFMGGGGISRFLFCSLVSCLNRLSARFGEKPGPS